VNPLIYFGTEIFLFVGIGLVAGLLAGLLGLGGGIVIVPALVFTFKYLHIPSDQLMQLAVGTSLAAMIINSFSSFLSHYKKKGVIFAIVKPMAMGILVGSCFAVLIAKSFSSRFLQTFFGIFQCLLGLYFLFPQKPPKKTRSLPSPFPLSLIGTGVAAISTILGIGGGLINVPIFTHYHIPFKKAIGTSAALSFLISVIGTLFFLIFAEQHSEVPYTIGFIYLPAFIVIGLVAFFTAPFGVKLAHSMPVDILKRLFGAILIFSGLSMIF
jgi:uncharacterized membrane protein YfcA